VPPLCAGGSTRACSVEPLRRTGGRVRLSGITLHLKRLVSTQIIAMNALMPRQTAFSQDNKFDEDTCQQKDNRGGFNEGH
jgi:hypothetical protein